MSRRFSQSLAPRISKAASTGESFALSHRSASACLLVSCRLVFLYTTHTGRCRSRNFWLCFASRRWQRCPCSDFLSGQNIYSASCFSIPEYESNRTNSLDPLGLVSCVRRAAPALARHLCGRAQQLLQLEPPRAAAAACS